MVEGNVILVTDRADRSHELAEALSTLAEVRLIVVGGTRGSGLIVDRDCRGIVTDVSFCDDASRALVSSLLTPLQHIRIPKVCVLRRPGGRACKIELARATAAGARACVSETATFRELAAVVVSAIHPGDSVVDRVVKRGLALSRQSVEAALDLAARGGKLDMAVVEAGIVPILNAIRIGGLDRWMKAVRGSVPAAHRHSLQVAGLAAAVAMDLRFPAADQRRFTRAALMHDLGKARMPRAILDKPGPLTEVEWAVMRTHPAVGHAMLVEGGVTDPVVLDCALHHHETLDGTGYPEGLRGDAVSDPVRLLTICDIYSAIVSPRANRPALSPEEAFRALRGMGSKLDAGMVDALARAVLRPPVAIAA